MTEDNQKKIEEIKKLIDFINYVQTLEFRIYDEYEKLYHFIPIETRGFYDIPRVKNILRQKLCQLRGE